MPVVRDCGDFQLSAHIQVGVNYGVGTILSKAKQKEREETGKVLVELKKEIEIVALDMMCKALGYTPEKRDKILSERDQKNAVDRKAETEGRAAKTKRRAGII